MSEMTLLRASDRQRWKVRIKVSIARHAGQVLHIAQDLLVGRATMKRWIAEDPELQHWVSQARRGEKLTPYVEPAKPRRRRRVA